MSEISLYRLEGLNFNKFLLELKKYNIEVFDLKKLDFKTFDIGIKNKDNKIFKRVVEKFNLKAKVIKNSTFYSFKNFLKGNFFYLIIVVIFAFFILATNNFVFKTEIMGLENLTYNEVKSVLEDSGFSDYKLKSAYDLNSIQKVLTSKIDKISFASAIIRGNTLIVNINEKIDTSKYVYNYSPIFAPCNLILREVNLLSGTLVKKINDTVKINEEIVVPYVTYENAKLPLPAKAKIRAYGEFFETKEVEKEDFLKNNQKIIEEIKNLVYNKIPKDVISHDLFMEVMQKEEENKIILTVYLKGEIEF